eukprot:5685142-Pleurochrysis_carterae.AAC.5
MGRAPKSNRLMSTCEASGDATRLSETAVRTRRTVQSHLAATEGTAIRARRGHTRAPWPYACAVAIRVRRGHTRAPWPVKGVARSLNAQQTTQQSRQSSHVDACGGGAGGTGGAGGAGGAYGGA